MMWRYNAAAIVTVMGAQLPMGPAAFPCDGGGDDDDNCHHHHYGSIANYKK